MTKESTKEIVYDAVVELHSNEQVITRETLASFIDVPQGVIDDRLKTLVNEGLLIRVQRGVYVPLQKHPATRVISQTELPCGTVIIDIGEQVLKLTPREARTLATMLAARATQAAQIQLGYNVSVLTNELSQRIRQVEKANRRISRAKNKQS